MISVIFFFQFRAVFGKKFKTIGWYSPIWDGASVREILDPPLEAEVADPGSFRWKYFFKIIGWHPLLLGLRPRPGSTTGDRPQVSFRRTSATSANCADVIPYDERENPTFWQDSCWDNYKSNETLSTRIGSNWKSLLLDKGIAIGYTSYIGESIVIITACDWSCGKVMFSVVSVCLSAPRHGWLFKCYTIRHQIFGKVMFSVVCVCHSHSEWSLKKSHGRPF